jgi:RNA polymerase sigma factor (sigma-70 family)
VTTPGDTERLLRALAPQALGALVRRHRDFAACEDALQEALLAAAAQWPRDGVPEQPRAWLVAVASRRLVDELRSDAARRRREEALAREPRPGEAAQADDTLTLLLLCCHPALTPASQIALTLRAVGGLTTAQIAAAFLVPEATMAQRISRAKATIRADGGGFAPPPPAERAQRLASVLHVLYLVFNEGYTATSGEELQSVELADEAIRLTRLLHRLLPEEDEVSGLLALMLLTNARRDARATADGSLVPLAEQDRTRWDRAAIAEGVALVEATLPRGAVGPYQLQAAIAAIHAEAAHADDTDWPQVLALYTLLERVAPGAMVTLNRAVATGMVHGPRAGLALVDELDRSGALAGHHRLDAVRGHLLERDGRAAAARDAYERAAQRTTSRPEQRYLRGRAAALARP